jgi:CHAT domain-containing protein
MKAAVVFLVCLILSWHLSAGVSAFAKNTDTKTSAQQLLSKKQTNHELAIQAAQQALALFQSINDQEGMGYSYLALGRHYYALNEMKQSAQNYESALQIWRERQNSQNTATALTYLGYIEGRRGEWPNGFSYLTQALMLSDNRNDLNQKARIAAGMGFFFDESGMPEYGLVQYQRAKEYFRQVSETRGYNRQIMLIGSTYLLLGNYAEAISNLQEALANFKSSDDEDTELDSADCEGYLGQVYLASGKYDLALHYLLPLPALYEKKTNHTDAAQIRGFIGEVYQRQGKIELARRNYLEALKSFREADDPVRKAAVAFALGRLELNAGNLDAAEGYLEESIQNTEDIRSDLNSRMLATAFSASVHERYETYIECLMEKHKLHPGQGLELRALEASELARARSLAALLRDTQTRVVSGIDPQLAAREKALRRAIHVKADQAISLIAADYKKAQLDEVGRSLTALREQHLQLTQQLERQNPQYDQIRDASNYSVQQIQEHVVEDNETMLLEYSLGKNASYAWAITRNDAQVYELPKAEVITSAVQDVYKLLAPKPDDDIEKSLNQAAGNLAHMVLTPLANHANIKRVIVVADGALNYIPFQSLPSASGNPLVASYEIINAPSASVLGQLRQENRQRPPATRIVAAFGDPVFRSNYAQFKNYAASDALVSAGSLERGFEVDADSLDPDKIQPLVYSKFELGNLSAIAGAGAFVATGFGASRAALENTDFSKYAILHFATHGLLDPQNPQKSGFFLSMVDEGQRDENGFITMEDVYNLRVPVALVVLSACRTGLGKDVRGEGLIGLTRGFMHAGASSVVASLWKVDDEATAELMKYFYTNMLKKRLPPAEALREAQNTLRQNPQWASPHFWAGFTLQGEFKDPIKLPPPTTAPPVVQKAVALSLLLTLFAAIFWGLRRHVGS